MKTKIKTEIVKVDKEDLETLHSYLKVAYEEEHLKSFQPAMDAFANDEIGYGVYLLGTLTDIDNAIEKMREILGDNAWTLTPACTYNNAHSN